MPPHRGESGIISKKMRIQGYSDNDVTVPASPNRKVGYITSMGD
jgi:hypothetical protein